MTPNYHSAPDEPRLTEVDARRINAYRRHFTLPEIEADVVVEVDCEDGVETKLERQEHRRLWSETT
jgi:hypothetical protein